MVAALLAKQAAVARRPGNGGPTIRGMRELEGYLGDEKWDVIHFNWGLYGTCTAGNTKRLTAALRSTNEGWRHWFID